MAVDLDWLISRFDRVSMEYPGLSLVAVPKPFRFTDTNCEVDCDASEGYRFYYPRINSSKYEPQWYWASDNTPERDERGVILFSTKHFLEFPRWFFSHELPVFERGWWAMWLHRTFGFDPSIEDPNQKLQTNAECLRAYQPLFELTTQVLLEHYEYEEWFIKWCPNCRAEQFNRCGPWLLFVLSHYKNIRKEQGVCVIDDIGIATILVLRLFKAKNQEPSLAVASKKNVSQGPYQTLWNYSQQKWASGSDKYKICQHITDGPGNYTECVEDLIPNVNRTDQSRRFHSVLGSLNKEIRDVLALEVYRWGAQILVCEVGRKPPEHERKPKQPTTKKSTTKRKR